MTKTIIGLYDHAAQAQAVVSDLVEGGVRRSNISLITRDLDRSFASALDPDPVVTEPVKIDEVDAAAGAATGAVVGGVVGGLGGLLFSLGVIAIPGVGPIIAAGPIIASLIGASIGATTGSLIGALVAWGVPETEAGIYAEAVRRGGTLVAARVSENQFDHVVQIMDRYNPVDLEERADFWREGGWAGYDPDVEPDPGDDRASEGQAAQKTATQDDVITRPYDAYQTHRADFEAHFHNYDNQIGQSFATVEPAYRFGYTVAHDDTYAGRQWREVESQIRRRWEAEPHTVAWDDAKDMIRHAWNIVVSGYYDLVRDYNYYEGDFSNHYYAHYSSSQNPYAYYQPAYHHGYTLASNPRYHDRAWDEIEAEARADWERRFESTWDNFKDAIRYAWDQVKDWADWDYELYQDDFQHHYETTYQQLHRDYEVYEPAYRLGYSLATNDHDWDLAWEELEPIAQSRWEMGHHDTLWDDVKDAVQYAWQRLTMRNMGFDPYGDDFRQYYETHNLAAPYTYADYEAAYSYGYLLATDERYEGRAWEEIEPNVRADWEKKNEGTWDAFKDTVRQAWNSITGADGDDSSRFQDEFRRHYETKYGSTGYPFADYERAYRHGYLLTQEPRYLNLDWDALEPELRQYWESEYRQQLPWGHYRDAAYYSWDLARARMYG